MPTVARHECQRLRAMNSLHSLHVNVCSIRLRTAFKPRSQLCMNKDGIGCEFWPAALNNLPYTCLCATVCRMAFLRKCALRTHLLQVAVQTSHSARANQDTRAPMAVNACCASQTGLFQYISHCTLFNMYRDHRIDILARFPEAGNHHFCQGI